MPSQTNIAAATGAKINTSVVTDRTGPTSKPFLATPYNPKLLAMAKANQGTCPCAITKTQTPAAAQPIAIHCTGFNVSLKNTKPNKKTITEIYNTPDLPASPDQSGSKK